MHPRRRLAATIAGVAVLAACGAPARVQTLANTRDARLVGACRSLEPRVQSLFPAVVAGARFVGKDCEWSDAVSTSATIVPVPSLIVGLVDTSGGTTELEQTRDFVEQAQSISGVGGRAVYDPQTRTLSVALADRLWYLQLVGSAAKDPNALRDLRVLAGDLAGSPSAR